MSLQHTDSADSAVPIIDAMMKHAKTVCCSTNVAFQVSARKEKKKACTPKLFEKLQGETSLFVIFY